MTAEFMTLFSLVLSLTMIFIVLSFCDKKTSC